jgi:hypothetical protein
MSTANRTIRPFVGLAGVGSTLDTAVMHFGPSVCPANQRVHVDLHVHEFMVRPVAIEWAPDDDSFGRFRGAVNEGLHAARIAPSDVELVAIAKSPYLKFADIVFRWRVSEMDRLPRRVDLTNGKRARAFSTPFTGFDLEVFLLVAQQLEPEPLKPSRKGTWLARVRCGVDTELSHVVFPPIPLTSEIRKSLGLSAKAMRYVDFEGHDVVLPVGEQEAPKFYVDAEFLAQLNARRGSPVSRALQIQLALDFVAGVVRAASIRADLASMSYDMVRSSLVGSIVRMVSSSAATDAQRDAIVNRIASRPDAVVADLEHVFDAAKLFTDALKEGDEE